MPSRAELPRTRAERACGALVRMRHRLGSVSVALGLGGVGARPSTPGRRAAHTSEDATRIISLHTSDEMLKSIAMPLWSLWATPDSYLWAGARADTRSDCVRPPPVISISSSVIMKIADIHRQLSA